MDLAQLERILPDVQWREPIWIQVDGAPGMACRVCIAQLGITGEMAWRLFSDRPAFYEHFVEHSSAGEVD